jgi:hypothetical protein
MKWWPNKGRDEGQGHLVETKVIGIFDDVDALPGSDFAGRLANLKTASEQ